MSPLPHGRPRGELYRNTVIQTRSNRSYVLNKKIIEVLNENSWKDKQCFIIGGGESLSGFDINRLNGELTIGINKAFIHYPNLTINYSMDSGFYDRMKDGSYDEQEKTKVWDKWMDFKGVRTFITPLELRSFGRETCLIRRLHTLELSRGDLDRGIYCGSNSGTGAITLAIALGAKTIYLLGYDFYTANGRTHWHSGYPGQDQIQFNNKLKTFCEDITKLSTLIHQTDIKVINLNPKSNLNCFEKRTIDEVINANI